MSRLDVLVAASFASAAVGEAAVRFHGAPAKFALNLAAAPALMTLASRRVRPGVALVAIGLQAVVVAVLTFLVWPGSQLESTFVVLAMMLATYSVGAYAEGRSAAAMALAIPLLVVLAIDLPTYRGWALANGVLFVGVFVGALPFIVGRMVRLRRTSLERLQGQREEIVRGQLLHQETAVLAQRVEVVEGLGVDLAAGLRGLAADATGGAPAAEIEDRARSLLARTRAEVTMLTADVTPPARPELHFPQLVGSKVPPPRFILMTLALIWCVNVAISSSLGRLDNNVAEAALALGTSFLAGFLILWPGNILGIAICIAGHASVTGFGDLIGPGAAMLASWAAGLTIRDLGQIALQLRETNSALASQAPFVTERAVVAERKRLARELHDELGHTLTVVAIQACAARRMAVTDPKGSQDIVRTLAQVAGDGAASISAPSDQSLGETGVGRELGELLARTRASGAVVSADLADSAWLSTEGVAVGYRIVQESLTNVLRHAPGSQVSVTFQRSGVHVQIAVINSAPTGSPVASGSGLGLQGILERVTMGGGEVSWGTQADGGFAVFARLPAVMELV